VLVAIMVVLLGGLQAAAYVVMTLLVIVWALFSAPTWCGAVNRQRGGEVEYCRNSSSGLLLGCWIRQHKFQHFTSGAPTGGIGCAESGRARRQSLQLFQPGSALSLEQSA
jgi:hypothetical protein